MKHELFFSQFAFAQDSHKHQEIRKSELLAPVGDFKMLHSAVDARADAVYFGLKEFNMRDAAKNFRLGDLKKIRKICGSVKMYLTLNVVVYDGELARIEMIIRRARDYVDAIVCWDFGVVELCRRYNVPFHVSTQASVSNVVAAKFYKKLGAERIVLARELSLKQIKKISKVVDVECFCHGAMCVAVSGRCFMSQYIHGLSANRGQCAQPCRRNWAVSSVDRSGAPGRSSSAVRPFHRQTASLPDVGVNIKDDSGNKLKLENSRVMSAKDLCALPFVEEMKKAGVKSFKIEGRNRSPEYVSVVVGEYRKALDGKLSRSEIVDGVENLNRVYNRGFSSGFYFGVPTADDFSWSENGEQRERKEFVGKVLATGCRGVRCLVRMNAGVLRVGDSCYLISDSVGCKRCIVKSIEFDGKGVEVTKKGDEVGVDFGIKVGSGVEVYKIFKK